MIYNNYIDVLASGNRDFFIGLLTNHPSLPEVERGFYMTNGRPKTGKILSCNVCKKEFYAKLSWSKKAKYCSQYCHLKVLHKLISGKNSNLYKRGWFYGKYGYIFIHKNGKQIPQHRYIMENYIKRLLTNREYVHHINGIRTDNRIENLKILFISDHQRLHSKLRIRDKKGRYT